MTIPQDMIRRGLEAMLALAAVDTIETPRTDEDYVCAILDAALEQRTDMPTLFDLEPTPAMLEHGAVVDQCAWCGTLVAWSPKGTYWGESSVSNTLGGCPACGRSSSDPAAGWRRQAVPVGPFRHIQTEATS